MEMASSNLEKINTALSAIEPKNRESALNFLIGYIAMDIPAATLTAALERVEHIYGDKAGA